MLLNRFDNNFVLKVKTDRNSAFIFPALKSFHFAFIGIVRHLGLNLLDNVRQIRYNITYSRRSGEKALFVSFQAFGHIKTIVPGSQAS